jgi:uncharacterized membrane protein HdeD (DUF308 family)
MKVGGKMPLTIPDTITPTGYSTSRTSQYKLMIIIGIILVLFGTFVMMTYYFIEGIVFVIFGIGLIVIGLFRIKKK